MTDLSFEEHIGRLRQGLAEPLPGAEAQRTMAPAARAYPSALNVEGKDCREAGVLALLYPSAAGAPVLVLTLRREDLSDHAGQISFPGGQREAGETLRETALREAREEIGLAPEGVELLGALTPLFIDPSSFCVHPFVGAMREQPALRPTDAEVEAILHVPLAHLLAPGTLVREEWTLHGAPVEVPFFAFDGHQVWGATAMMLAELLALFWNAASPAATDLEAPPS